MRRLGIVIMVVGMVFLLSGVAAVAWATSQASAMSEEDKIMEPELYSFYCSAQSCSLGSAVIGMMIVTVGFLVGRRSTPAVKKGQMKEVEEGLTE